MTSVFQMNRVVVIGHSLSDQNIKHVLEAAKQGAGVIQPVCWIAPDVIPSVAREFLEKYRVRVISYDNRDGEHNNLLRLIENITDFIPPRTSIHIQDQIAKVSQSSLGTNAAAPGFYVFNNLAIQSDFDKKRVDIVLAAIQSTLPYLSSLEPFTLKAALEIAGWPSDQPIGLDFSNQIYDIAIERKLLSPVGDKLKIGSEAESLAQENKNRFDHMRERFKTSLVLRLKRAYPSLTDSEASRISVDIEASLTGYFREGGLTLATTLFSSAQPHKQTALPSSILKFITEASTRYDDLLKRQAFCTVSVDAFIRAESAEREYLGRISQGFFAFHSLGVFGDTAIERLRHAKSTVWLIDSSAQIQALALASPTNAVFRDCFSRLHEIGVRLFTTQKLFNETREHLWFANKLIRDNGPASPLVISAATGQAPYRKTNQFLEGFVRWQAAGNPCDWENYLFQEFEHRNPDERALKNALNKIGIEVIFLQDWPGFSDSDYAASSEYHSRIIQTWESRQEISTGGDPDLTHGFYKKAQPEAEALVIIKRERDGNYHMLSNSAEKSPAWFISHTSILNLVENGSKITWQPEAFLRFTSTLSHTSDARSANQAFETLLWGFAQSGLSLLDDKILARVFGGIIDQATLNIAEQQQAYDDTLAQKYGESSETVMARISPLNRPLAAIQLANEIAQKQTQRRQDAETITATAIKRATIAEKKLGEVERFRRKMEAKKVKGRRKARRQQSSSKKRKRK